MKKTMYVVTTEHDYLSDKGTKVEVVGVAEAPSVVPALIRKAISDEREEFPVLDEHLLENPIDDLIPETGYAPKTKISYLEGECLFVIKVTAVEPSPTPDNETAKGEPEALTYGLLRELMGNRNIPVLESLLFGHEDDEVITELVDNSGVFAMKRWSMADLEGCLEEDGFEPSKENVMEVLNAGNLKYLEDCTEDDWELIHDAICQVKENLKRMDEDVPDEDEEDVLDEDDESEEE